MGECKFLYRCPLRWEGLRNQENDFSRFCEDCGKTVHFAHSVSEIDERYQAGKCFAITYTEDVKFTEEIDGEEVEITFPERKDGTRQPEINKPEILMGFIAENNKDKKIDWAQPTETENKPASFLTRIFKIFKK